MALLAVLNCVIILALALAVGLTFWLVPDPLALRFTADKQQAPSEAD